MRTDPSSWKIRTAGIGGSGGDNGRYLQREIREGRRNVGALKLSNLLQPDRFEEDLNIRRVRLEPLPRPGPPTPTPLPEREREMRRLQGLQQIRQIKESLR